MNHSNSLRDFSISPEDIDHDFGERHQRYQMYVDFFKYIKAHRRASSGDFLKKCRPEYLQDPAVCKEQKENVNNWRSGRTTPHSVRAVIRLHQLGVFLQRDDARGKTPKQRVKHGELQPFDYKNKHFLAMAMLSNIEFWTGSLYRSKRPGTTITQLDIVTRHLDALLIDFLSHVGGTFNKTGPERIDMSGPVSRFVAVMGCPIGSKSTSEVALPRHIQAALGTLQSKEPVAEDEQQVAFQAVRDFIIAFFYLHKCQGGQGRSYRGYLPSSTNHTTAFQRFTDFGEAVKCSKIDLPILIHPPKAAVPDSTYRIRIHFPKMNEEKLAALRAQFAARVTQMTEGLRGVNFKGQPVATELSDHV